MKRLKIGLKTFEEIVLNLKYFCRRLPWRVFILLYIRNFCEGRSKRRLIKVTVWRHLRRYQLNFSFRSNFWSQFFDFFMLLSIDLTSSGHISFIDEFFPTFFSSQKDQSPTQISADMDTGPVVLPQKVRIRIISRRWSIFRTRTVTKNFLAYVTNVKIFLIWETLKKPERPAGIQYARKQVLNLV